LRALLARSPEAVTMVTEYEERPARSFAPRLERPEKRTLPRPPEATAPNRRDHIRRPVEVEPPVPASSKARNPNA
jgi:hypothetical protein